MLSHVFADEFEWDRYFREGKLGEFHFDLGNNQDLAIKVPPGFKYICSKETEYGILFKFMPEDEREQQWSQMFTVIVFPFEVNDFKDFVREYSSPCFPVYSESLKFNTVGGINTYCYAWDGCAIEFPECEKIEELDEMTLKFGFQGKEGIFVISSSIRYDEKVNGYERKEIGSDLFKFLQDSFTIFEHL